MHAIFTGTKRSRAQKNDAAHNGTIKQLAADEGISEATLYNWRREARSKGILMPDGDGEVTFVYKNRKNNNRTERTTLDASEFIRRFLLHVLPKKFMKIRYFGFLFHREKRKNIDLIRKLIGASPACGKPAGESARDIMLRITGKDIALCPKC